MTQATLLPDGFPPDDDEENDEGLTREDDRLIRERLAARARGETELVDGEAFLAKWRARAEALWHKRTA